MNKVRLNPTCNTPSIISLRSNACCLVMNGWMKLQEPSKDNRQNGTQEQIRKQAGFGSIIAIERSSLEKPSDIQSGSYPLDCERVCIVSFPYLPAVSSYF